MIAANVALIAVLQAIRLRWLQLNSGFNCLSKLSLICAPIPSPCTSRNLNLNPFCKLTDNPPCKVEASNPCDVRKCLGDS